MSQGAEQRGGPFNGLRETLRTLAVAGVLVSLLAAQDAPSGTAEPVGTDPEAPEVLDVIGDLLTAVRDGEADATERAHARLARRGPDAIPAMLDVLLLRVPVEGDGAPGLLLDRAGRAELLAVLQEESPEVTLDALALAIGEEATLSERMQAMQIAGEVGDARALTLIVQLLAEADPVHRRHPLVRSRARSALVAVLQRDQEVPALLRGIVRDVDPDVLVPLVEAFGELGNGECVSVLQDLLGLDPELDLAVLGTFGNLKPWDRAVTSGAAPFLLRGRLDANDPVQRRQAVIALGRLRDSDSFADLVTCLRDPDRRVHQSALWSLGEITGQHTLLEADQWYRWERAEEDWLEQRVDALLLATSGRHPGPAIAALGEIASHPFAARKIAGEVARAIHHRDAAVAAGACTVLATLDEPAALPYLVNALEDERPEVQVAALEALRTMTGVELSDAADWRGLIES